MPRRCPSCGTAAASANARHCHVCGTPLGAAGAADVDAGGAASREPAREPSGTPPPPGAPRPSDPPTDVRNMAMLAHLSALAALFFGGLSLLGPLLVWLVKRDMHPFVERHAREALNFNISVLIYGIAAAVSLLLVVGIVLLPALFVFWLVVTIIAAVRASNGQAYRYPLSIRFLT